MNMEDLNDDLRPEYDLQSLKVRKIGKGRKRRQKKEENSEISMKETDELLPEYDLNYSKAKPNRFAKPTPE